jgi:outer membrane protein assembly factor BamB
MRCRAVLSAVLLTLTVSLAVATDWPQWRGLHRDGISPETGLLQEWPADGPKIRWKRTDIGAGFSTPVVVGGKVYLQTNQDIDPMAANPDAIEYALCLDEKTGQDIWKTPIGKVGANRGLNYNGTRSTPTVDGDRLYCLSSAGQLVCLTTDGKPKWQKDLIKDLGGVIGGEKAGWSYSESVLVDGDLVICTPGGETATLAALNKSTGEVVWKCAVPGGDAAEYSSIMITEAGGVKQYVTFLRKGLVGVDAKTGKFLWQYTKVVDPGANIMTPNVYRDRIFVSASRGGGAVIELKNTNGKIAVNEVFFNKSLGASIGSALLIDGYLYGATTQGLFCADFATGKEQWLEKSIGNASLCFADGRIYARSFAGDIFLVEPNPKEYIQHGRVKQPNRSKISAWPHPVVANGGLYVRDMNTLVCFDVKKQ